MRHVEISLRPETRKPVLERLKAEDVDYTVVRASIDGEYVALVSFTLPTNAVEPILDDLQDAGVDEDDHTVVVTADTIISRKFGALKERYTDELLGDDRLSRHELYTEADSLISTVPIYITMTVVSAIVATAGLLLDSPAVVVGSMVIAPLIGPGLAASVGTVLDESDLFWKGVRYQALGVAVAIIGAAAFAWLARSLLLVPPGIDILELDEVTERLLPDLLSLFVAFGAGVAGVLSLATGISVALVGVMIAAALIPPAAAAGIAIAWGAPNAAIGSVILVFVNLLSINITGLITLWAMGYRPELWGGRTIVRKQVRRRVIVLAVAILVLSTFLAGVTWASYERATLEEDVTVETEAVLDSQEYQDVHLVDVELFLEIGTPFELGAILDEGTVLERPERVVITVEHPIEETYADLSGDLRDRINERTAADVTVHVRFVEYQETG